MKIEKVEKKEIIEDKMNEIYDMDDKKKDVEIGFENFAYALKNDKDEIVVGIQGWKAFTEIYVDELCLAEEFRGLGYGKKLLEIVESDMNKNKIKKIVNLINII